MSHDSLRELSSVRTWLFDFDNTIAALEPTVDWASSRVKLEALLRREGVGDAIFSAIPKGNLPLYDALLSRVLRAETIGTRSGLARTDPMELLRQASTLIETHELVGAAVAEPLPGAIELIKGLVALDVRVVIVTSNASRTVMRWLERFDLDQCIETIIGRDSMLPLKPAPDMALRALAQAEQKAEEACFVGDSDADALAAERSAIPFLGVAASDSKRRQLQAHKAVGIFATPAELQRRVFALD